MFQNGAIPPWNQTEEASYLVAERNPDVLGVATFLVPAPEIGALEEKVVTVAGLTFNEASKRARNLVAFEWHSAEEWKSLTADPAFNDRASCSLWGGGGRACPSSCMCGSGNHCAPKGAFPL